MTQHKKDSLGDRMKAQYEVRSQTYLPRRTYAIIRLDGKAFHTYTRGLQRPFDEGFMRDMDETAIALMAHVQGAKVAYVQSDEISIVLTDFDQVTTDAWFDGNVQKIVSISASIATANFNAQRPKGGMAFFDSRVFIIPDPVEVENYFIWRQQDATRNSIQMAAQSMFSHGSTQNQDCNVLQERMFTEKGVNWNDYPDGFKRGRAVVKRNEWKPFTPKGGLSFTPENERYMPLDVTLGRIIEVDGSSYVGRTSWVSEAPPVFTKDRTYIRSRISPVEEG